MEKFAADSGTAPAGAQPVASNAPAGFWLPQTDSPLPGDLDALKEIIIAPIKLEHRLSTSAIIDSWNPPKNNSLRLETTGI